MNNYKEEQSMLIAHPVSVIIPVRNGAKTIKECLNAVFEQSLKPFEVIVVDGQSTDNTIDIAMTFPVKLLKQTYGRCAAARQMGLEVAQGEYVAFTDSDCVPDKDWLQNLVTELKENIIGVGGGIKNVGEGLWIRSINLAQNTFVGGGSSIQTRLIMDKRFVKSISGANSMYRKKDILEIGGFNVRLTGADETELNSRLLKSKKGKLLYTPKAAVIHNHGRNLKEFAGNMYHYGRWRRECRVWDFPIIPALLFPFVLLTVFLQYWIFLVLALIYVLIILAIGSKFAIQNKSMSYMASIPIVFVVLHGCYILGFWREAIFPVRVKK